MVCFPPALYKEVRVIRAELTRVPATGELHAHRRGRDRGQNDAVMQFSYDSHPFVRNEIHPTHSRLPGWLSVSRSPCSLLS